MRVLGIDPGLTRMGMGVVEGAVGRPLALVDVNVIRTSSHLPVAERLVSIEKGIDAWLDEHRPDAVAVERVFARSDVSTVMGTAQASGIAMVCAARRGLPIALHTPSEVKAAVSGSGRATKQQVGAMVTRILRLEVAPKPADAADALALAITFALVTKRSERHLRERLDAATQRARQLEVDYRRAEGARLRSLAERQLAEDPSLALATASSVPARVPARLAASASTS